MNERLRYLLTKHEGLRLKPYLDTVGKITIGIGRNLDDKGISEDEANFLFENDVDEATIQVIKVFPNFHDWSINRQNALIDMVFNMGITRFMGFKKMIAAIKNGDWVTAAAEMRDSKWAEQLPRRVAELAIMVEKG